MAKLGPHLFIFVDFYPQQSLLVVIVLATIMFQPRGNALLATVTMLTSLGFLLIGFDNGLMGGLGRIFYQHLQVSNSANSSIVNGTAFKDTFNSPSSTMIGVIVAIYEGWFFLLC